MPTRAGEPRGQRPGGLGTAARAVSEHISSLVHLEIELALSELKKKAASVGVGVGLLVGGALFAFFGLGFLLAAAAAGIALALPWWASLLIVAGMLFLLTGLLVFIGLTMLQKATPPVPEQAIEEARLTTEALKNGH